MFRQERADSLYKRRGQRQLLAILDGHAQQAVKLCRARISQEPDDLESWFMLCVAQCQLGDLPQAMTVMRRAVAAGLPVERFLAGPRQLLEPLTSSEAFHEFLSQQPVRWLHGPMLGAVTDGGARLWVRTPTETKVTVRVFREPENGQPAAAASCETTRDADYTGVLHINGLMPDTPYYYELLLGEETQPRGKRQTFRTYPKTGRPARFRIAFGGGAGFTPQHERIWDTMASFDLAGCLLLGDNVYIDLPEQPGPLHRYTYYRRQSRPEFLRLMGSTPIYAIWDDHDAAIDDVWLGPHVDRPAWKRPMLSLFQQNWNNPSYGNRETPGCWFRFSIGDVDLFLLDCRFYRTNPFGTKPSMLGPVQKAWLAEGLKTSQATFKLVVSSVAWAPEAKPGSRDTWDGFPAEREEIFSWIKSEQIDGVLLISADRHRSDAWRIERKDAYPLYDLMSSRLTNIHTHELMEPALFGYNEKCSFGLLTFETEREDPQVTYQIVNIDGEIMNRLVIPRSELSF